MKNRDIYQTDPVSRKLANQGVANVNDDTTRQAMEVLRYELETFVCDGQYEAGMHDILESYLKNIDKPQQEAVWVSGFFGSGKSHLVKMLRALWVDTKFDDGAKASSLTQLPDRISDQLKELRTQSARHGGLHAASGTLGSGASGSVRLALLGIVFKSAGLPEQYQVARFIMWLKKNGIFDQVRDLVEKNGYDWEEELDNFYVAEGLHQALVSVKPGTFSSTVTCVDTLNNMYPNVNDVTNDEMLKAIKDALSKEGKFPLTLIVLDEVQQYIGTYGERSISVQEVVESCSKNIGGKLLFVGTGQTAVTGTNNLKKLEGRFTIRVELSDADVDAVIRKVILAKNPASRQPIEDVMQKNLGEVSRHLSGTTIAHRQDDIPYFPQDYPLLPVRRRFWENTLRALDQTGTDSQLRNQLSMVHKVIQTNLDQPLGSVVPADYLYFDSADKLLQFRILPRRVHEKTMEWNRGSEDDKLRARACGLVFLVTKLGGENQEIGIKADVDTIADLMVEDLSAGSGNLRNKLPKLMDDCGLLMKVGSEYRIHTEESSAWNDEFAGQQANLANEAYRIDAERDDRIRKKFRELCTKLSLSQGSSKVPRDLFPVFDNQLPTDAQQKIYVWVRDGWVTDENTVLADARQAGNTAPTVFVYLPKRAGDDLRRCLSEFKAANATLQIRGVPNTPEGLEAKASMETRLQAAEGKINSLLDDVFSGVQVYQAGGKNILGNNLQEMVLEAAQSSLARLYKNFSVADHIGWPKVYEKAKKGAPDALVAVGDQGEVTQNPVCKAILGGIGAGKSGMDIREQFEGKDYGWPRDAVDGGLQVLLNAGLIRAQDDRGNAVDSRNLERKAIGKARFKVEATTITTAQRLQIRKVLQKAGLTVKQGEEQLNIETFLQKVVELADKAGGEAPKPEKPDTKFLDDLRVLAGNDQLMGLYNLRDQLKQSIEEWGTLADAIDKRWPEWMTLAGLLIHAASLDGVDAIQQQVKALEDKRQLLANPNPVTPLVNQLTQLLRDELNSLKSSWDKNWDAGQAKLEADENWKQLDPEQRIRLRAPQGLTEAATPKVDVSSMDTILSTLSSISIDGLRDRIVALPARYDQVLVEAAKLLEPAVQQVYLNKPTIKTEADLDDWIKKTHDTLKAQLSNGPVIPQ